MAASGVGECGVKRLKVLVSAYACEPEKGSEPGVGWNCARQIARFHEVWLITRASNRSVIEAGLAAAPLPGAHFVYFDLPRWMRFWKRGRRGVLLYYYLWQIGAYFVVKKLHRNIGFDLAHHVTFVKYWAPSFLALLGVPFIWGPVGGGESTPRGFQRSFSPRGKVHELMRDLARRLGELDPFVRWTARRATIALATTPETFVKYWASSGFRRWAAAGLRFIPKPGCQRKSCGGWRRFRHGTATRFEWSALALCST